MLLQLRVRSTEEQSPQEFEVSVRTIYRDIEQLRAAGIPKLSDRGPSGGFQLVEGFRTKLTGLASPEAEALLMIGMPQAAATIGPGEAERAPSAGCSLRCPRRTRSTPDRDDVLKLDRYTGVTRRAT
jgi:predicted DNA-binding transcriptional regulator YafY